MEKAFLHIHHKELNALFRQFAYQPHMIRVIV